MTGRLRDELDFAFLTGFAVPDIEVGVARFDPALGGAGREHVGRAEVDVGAVVADLEGQHLFGGGARRRVLREHRQLAAGDFVAVQPLFVRTCGCVCERRVADQIHEPPVGARADEAPFGDGAERNFGFTCGRALGALGGRHGDRDARLAHVEPADARADRAEEQPSRARTRRIQARAGCAFDGGFAAGEIARELQAGCAGFVHVRNARCRTGLERSGGLEGHVPVVGRREHADGRASEGELIEEVDFVGRAGEEGVLVGFRVVDVGAALPFLGARGEREAAYGEGPGEILRDTDGALLDEEVRVVLGQVERVRGPSFGAATRAKVAESETGGRRGERS